MSSYRSLVENFEKTKKELKEAESTIRRITGRDPDDVVNSSGRSGKFRRSSTERATFSGRKRPYTTKKYPKEYDSINEDESDDEYESDESPSKKPAVQSTVVAKRRPGISRRATIEELNSNVVIKNRNKRMFGAIIGTLEKFKREEKEREHKELKRVEIEKKVEEKHEVELERMKKEKESLIITRKEKKIELRCLEKKLERAEPFEVFEANHRFLENYIITRTKPQIFFLPASHTPVTKKRLSVSRSKIQETVKKHKKSYEADMAEISEWYKKYSVPSEKENECPKEGEESQDVPKPESEAAAVVFEPPEPKSEAAAIVIEPEVITISDDEDEEIVSKTVQERKKSYEADMAEIDEWYKKDSVPSEKENECPKEGEESQDVPEPESEAAAVVVEPEEVITIPDDDDDDEGVVSSTTQNIDSLADQDFEPIYD